MNVAVGERIRALRMLRGLTQKELGDRCDLSKGFISQLETDQAAPSLETLGDILDVLGVSFAEFFSRAEQDSPVYHRDDMFGKEMEGGGTITWLVTTAQAHDMEPILLQLPPGASSRRDDPHSGEEFGYVLSGSPSLYLGMRRFRLHRGDAFYYKADQEHYIQNGEKTAATVLWVSDPPTF